MSVERLEAAIWLLERLVAFDTESSKSNLALIAAVEDHLRARDVNYVKVPNAAGDKAALFATIGPMCDGGVVLSALAGSEQIPIWAERGSAPASAYSAASVTAFPHWQYRTCSKSSGYRRCSAFDC